MYKCNDVYTYHLHWYIPVIYKYVKHVKHIQGEGYRRVWMYVYIYT